MLFVDFRYLPLAGVLIYSIGLKNLEYLYLTVLTSTKYWTLYSFFSPFLQPSVNKPFLFVFTCRIEAVYNSDKILVMDNGRVKEFSPPQELLNNPRSLFKALVETTGPLQDDC